MKSSRMSAIALPVVLIAAAVTASPALAHGMAMGQGYGTAAPCYGQHGMMGQGMGPGMMGQSTGPGMMSQGMGPGMMGSGMMGSGMMGPGMMGPGMMGQGMGPPSGGTAPYRDRDLTVDEVKSILGHRLEHNGNERLRVGKVEEKDDDVIIAEVETVDGSLVERYAVDRHTGRMQRSK